MVKSLAVPGKYFQGKNILIDIDEYVQFMGDKFLLVTDAVVAELVRQKIETSLQKSGLKMEFTLFSGESTQAEAERIAAVAKEKNCVGIIGAGGGKVIDTAKLSSDIAGLKVIIIPTAAASDAPCSARSVVYDEDGVFVVSKAMKYHPDVVLVDTQIIAEAPVRLLVAGMGDAFATFYEARACKRSGAKNFTGGTSTEAGFNLAVQCNELLLKYGAEAKAATEKRVWSEAIEKIAEANIFMSGVGFENNGCAIAHAVYNGLTAVLKPLPVLHGEGVAYGTIIQLIAEYNNSKIWDKHEWQEVVDFYQSVGLPLTLADLGVKEISDELLTQVAEATCTQSPNAHKMPFTVTPQVIKAAMIKNIELFAKEVK